jgi:hypothetical protein
MKRTPDTNKALLADYKRSSIGIYAVDSAGKDEKQCILAIEPRKQDQEETFSGFNLFQLIDYLKEGDILFIENSALAYILKLRKEFVNEMQRKGVTVYATAQRATPYLSKICKLTGVAKSDVRDAMTIARAHVDEDGNIIPSRACRKFRERGVSFYEDNTVGYNRDELKFELIYARLDAYIEEFKDLKKIFTQHKFESDIFKVYTTTGKVGKALVSKLLLQIFVKSRYLFNHGITSHNAMKKELGLNAHGHGNQIRASVMNTTNGKLFTLMKSILKQNDEYKNLVADEGAKAVPKVETDNGELRYDIGKVISMYENGEPLLLADKQKAYLRVHCEDLQFRRKVRNDIIHDINRFYGYLKSVYRADPSLFAVVGEVVNGNFAP